MVKIVKIPNLEIEAGKGKAFQYRTPPELPSAHMVTLAVGKRGSGKTVAITNLIKKLKYDRIFVISPTFHSNSALMKDLDIDEDDVYEDVDDPTIITKIIEKIDEERDELETYLEQVKEYKKLLKMLNDSYENIPDELLLQFYNEGKFEPPQHKYGGRNPFIAVIIDDAQSSKLFSNKRLLNSVTRHRHISPFKDDRPSIGVSMFFLIQNYKSQSGGCPRTVRNNCTNAIIFKNKDEKELDFIASEMAGEVDKETFMKAYDYAMNDGDYPFLFIDLHKKKEHPSMFRSRFNKFICL